MMKIKNESIAITSLFVYDWFQDHLFSSFCPQPPFQTPPFTPSIHGQIHSIYRRTINLLFDNQLFALQAADSALSPISIITMLPQTKFDSLNFSPNTSVTFQNNALIFSNALTFNFKNTYIKNLTLNEKIAKESYYKLTSKINIPKEQEEYLTSLQKEILCVLQHQAFGSLELLFVDKPHINQSFFLDTAEKILTEVQTAITNRSWCSAALSLCRLIGLGTGLTPSGDDFLTGILAGLILCNLQHSQFSQSLHQLISLSLNNTNLISAAFLKCALKGQFSLAINHLLDNPKSHYIQKDFQQIGHSSGIDTLCGIYFLLKNHHNIS